MLPVTNIFTDDNYLNWEKLLYSNKSGYTYFSDIMMQVNINGQAHIWL